MAISQDSLSSTTEELNVVLKKCSRELETNALLTRHPRSRQECFKVRQICKNIYQSFPGINDFSERIMDFDFT